MGTEIYWHGILDWDNRDNRKLAELKALTQRTADLLSDYVNQGGTLILGASTGQKDDSGKCVMTPMPGLLAGLTHTTVDDSTFVGPADVSVEINWNGVTLDSGVYNDILNPADPPSDEPVTVLARYTSNYYAGAPALTERRVGRGRVLHFGGTFTRDNTAQFLKYCGIDAPWEDRITLPEDCELCVREKEGQRWFFVLNYAASEQKIILHRPMKDADRSTVLTGEILLPAYGVGIYLG